MSINKRIIISLKIIILGILILLLNGCPKPDYKWEYWLPDKSNPVINIDGYEIIHSITAFKYRQDQIKNLEPGHIGYSVKFETYYHQLSEGPLVEDSVPIIEVDSVYIVLPPDNDSTLISLTCTDRYLLFEYQDKWMGPDFYARYDIPEDQMDLIIIFSVILKHRITHEIIKSEKHSFELHQFYDRFWYFAK